MKYITLKTYSKLRKAENENLNNNSLTYVANSYNHFTFKSIYIHTYINILY